MKVPLCYLFWYNLNKGVVAFPIHWQEWASRFATSLTDKMGRTVVLSVACDRWELKVPCLAKLPLSELLAGERIFSWDLMILFSMYCHLQGCQHHLFSLWLMRTTTIREWDTPQTLLPCPALNDSSSTPSFLSPLLGAFSLALDLIPKALCIPMRRQVFSVYFWRCLCGHVVA